MPTHGRRVGGATDRRQNQSTPEVATRLAAIAAADIDVEVRSQLASTAKRLPTENALPIIAAYSVETKMPEISIFPS